MMHDIYACLSQCCHSTYSKVVLLTFPTQPSLCIYALNHKLKILNSDLA